MPSSRGAERGMWMRGGWGELVGAGGDSEERMKHVGTGKDSEWVLRKGAAFVRHSKLVPWESLEMPEQRHDVM